MNNSVKRSGVLYLLRHVIVITLGIFTNLVLIKFLNPRNYGDISVINLCIGIISIIADGGFNAAFIVQKDKINARELSNIFSLQLFVWVFLEVLLFIIILIFIFLGISPSIVAYVGVTALTIPLVIHKAIAFVVLEKEINFSQIAIIETIEAILFTIVAISCAIFGYGVWSIVIASVIKAMSGWILCWKIVGFESRICIPRLNQAVFEKLRFGITYNVPSLISICRGLANPVLVGSILGLSAVGICDRATFIAGLPLLLLTAVQNKVLLPFFAKHQFDRPKLANLFMRSLFISNVTDKAIFVPLIVFAQFAIPWFFGEKWKDMMFVVTIMAIGNAMAGSIWAMASPFLNAVGQSQIIAKMSIITAAISWITLIPSLMFFGISGYAIVSLINWLPTFYLLKILERELCGERLLKSIVSPLIAGGISCGGALMLIHNSWRSEGVAVNLGLACITGVTYLVLLGMFDYRRCVFELRQWKSYFPS